MKNNSAKITKMIKITRSNTSTAQGRGIKTSTQIREEKGGHEHSEIKRERKQNQTKNPKQPKNKS